LLFRHFFCYSIVTPLFFRRHPSEGWGPSLLKQFDNFKMDASLRWHDDGILWVEMTFSAAC
jgi:hypothetical protein